MRSRSMQAGVLIAVIATIVVNGLATTLPINGQETGAISDSFDVYFVPAGYVFSIWGLIYLGLVAYAIYQALPAQRANTRLAAIDAPFLLSSAANIVWIFAWHYLQFVASLAIMLVLLGSLIAVYRQLAATRESANRAERWLVDLVFSVYLGWITVATIANATIVLDYVGWSGFGVSDEVWLVLMLAAALTVGGLMMWFQRDVAYLLVLVWAFAGIAIKQSEPALVRNAAWLAAAVVLGMVVFAALRRSPPAPLTPLNAAKG